MTEEQKRELESTLWGIANTLRGKMDADHFRDYILGFIFYKYLSEKMRLYANKILAEDAIEYLSIEEQTAEGQEYLETVREEAIEQLGYFLKPSELSAKLPSGATPRATRAKEILFSTTFKKSSTTSNKAPWGRRARTISTSFSKTWT